jgi:2-C-methyl-D-erythritol 4-phosphate cytidylyltransferase
MDPKRRFAVIVAGGKGVRVGGSIAKQFIEVRGKPILVHTIEAFLNSSAQTIVVVISDSYLSLWAEIKKNWFSDTAIFVASSGETRFESVKNGLDLVTGEGVVAIHDAARPCVTVEIIDTAYEQALKVGSAVPVIPLKDSIRKKIGNHSQAQDRAQYLSVQTPQVFEIKLVKEAYRKAKSIQYTDDASVVEALGVEVQLITGAYQNIKVTTAEDLDLVDLYFKKKTDF